MTFRTNSIPATYVRGGTSRAIIFRRADLPDDETLWKPLFQSVIGSPDPDANQLDGMGGGITSLSKLPLPPHPHGQMPTLTTFSFR